MAGGEGPRRGDGVARGKLALEPPPGLVGATFGLQKDEFCVLGWLTREGREGTLASKLTPAEAEVVRLVRGGCSNEEIGRRRGTSPRTVANQIAAVFRKLEVRSRLELYLVGGAMEE